MVADDDNHDPVTDPDKVANCHEFKKACNEKTFWEIKMFDDEINNAGDDKENLMKFANVDNCYKEYGFDVVVDDEDIQYDSECETAANTKEEETAEEDGNATLGLFEGTSEGGPLRDIPEQADTTQPQHQEVL